MPRATPRRVLINTSNSRFLIFICIFTCTYVLWTQLGQPEYRHTEEYDVSLAEEVIESVGRDSRFAEVYRTKKHLRKDLKYILLWTRSNYFPFYNFGTGQKAFITQNCSVIDCYVTSDRNFFGGDLTKFHVIAFNGRNILSYTKKDLPEIRAPHQKYLYVNSESAHYYEHCQDFFDGFFNWTFTVRLDSDIPNPYFSILNPAGDIEGPKADMKWMEQNFEDIDSFDKNLSRIFKKRTKAAAWFVSNCASKSKREDFVEKLKKALKYYNLSVDVYGSCGPLKCPLQKQQECEAMLEKDYFFYMSLENSFARDYVTEKVLTAVQNNVIPIVWGGANYSRFLPPNSYIDGRKTTPEELAFRMASLINSPKKYKKFFRWKKYYSYRYNKVANICDLCASMNDQSRFEKYSSYPNFRKWWNERKCK